MGYFMNLHCKIKEQRKNGATRGLRAVGPTLLPNPPVLFMYVLESVRAD